MIFVPIYHPDEIDVRRITNAHYEYVTTLANVNVFDGESFNTALEELLQSDEEALDFTVASVGPMPAIAVEKVVMDIVDGGRGAIGIDWFEDDDLEDLL